LLTVVVLKNNVTCTLSGRGSVIEAVGLHPCLIPATTYTCCKPLIVSRQSCH